MSTPQQSRGPSPLRVGGLALIGVGAVAGLIGLATLLPGGEGNPPAASPSASTTTSAGAVPGGGTSASGTPAPGGPGASGSASASQTPGAVPVPGFPSTGENGVAAPPGGVVGPGGAGPGGAGTGGAGTGGAGSGGAGSGELGSGGGGIGGTVAATTPVRVYNNSTVTGLANRAADEFRAQGWTVTNIGNYPQKWGVIPTSTVYYRPGTSEESAADQLGQAFGMRVLPRYAGIDDASPGVIVILTNDFKTKL